MNREPLFNNVNFFQRNKFLEGGLEEDRIYAVDQLITTIKNVCINTNALLKTITNEVVIAAKLTKCVTPTK